MSRSGDFRSFIMDSCGTITTNAYGILSRVWLACNTGLAPYSLQPNSVFYRLCPELHHGGKTRSGTPVRVQLLGQDPQWMAENAHRACNLGSAGIDINFGCPAKAVNKSRGGAVLLKEPELIYQIVKATRAAVNPTKPVTAKVRLGWDDPQQCFEIADAIAQAGADEMVIHARTKDDGYKADTIKWDYIRQLRQHVTLPIIANGEVWNHADGQACLTATNTDALMASVHTSQI